MRALDCCCIFSSCCSSVAAEPKQGDVFCIIDYRWWLSWLEYVNQKPLDAPNDGSFQKKKKYRSSMTRITFKRPSAINNSDLIKQAGANDNAIGFDLRDNLVNGADYELLPEEIWNQLHAWYEGGPTLARKVISSGLLQAELSVEVYPLRLHLNLIQKGKRSTIRISKKETVGELHKKACEIFGLEPDQVKCWFKCLALPPFLMHIFICVFFQPSFFQACIWNYLNQHKHALMNDMDKALEDVNILMDQDILVDFSDNCGHMRSVQEDGSGTDELMVFVDPSKVGMSVTRRFIYKQEFIYDNSELPQLQNQTTPREVKKIHGMPGVGTRGSSMGLTGLSNLGNTCYMNSAIQCLVHTPEFASYFLKEYRHEINWHNSLGNAG